MSQRCRVRLLVPLGLLLATPTAARADGGAVRTRQSVGPLVVTVFTTPTPLTAGPADVSVMVQDRASLEPLLDARVRLLLAPESAEGPPRRPGPGQAGPTRTTSAVATRTYATNKLLYAAPVLLSRPGRWRLRVSVGRGGQVQDVVCTLPVEPPAPRLLAYWPWLALPFLALGLAALNIRLARAQRASRRRR